MSERTLSPSRAQDFKKCPQRFKYRHVDEMEEAKSPAAATGNLVHAVLEDLMKEEPQARTRLKAEEIFDKLILQTDTEWSWLTEEAHAKADRFLDNYFEMEDPTQVRPVELEWFVSHDIGELTMRGIIDRRDEGDILVDYKTGRTPSEQWEKQAFFGLRFYATVVWRSEGFIPKLIKLLYLDSMQTISLEPTEQMLSAFEKQIKALDNAIARAANEDRWLPSPGGLCKACSFTDICPAWEGIVPPWKETP